MEGAVPRSGRSALKLYIIFVQNYLSIVTMVQVNSYRLKIKYHLDVSMMQRLVQNSVPFAQLQFQNRLVLLLCSVPLQPDSLECCIY